VLTFTNPADLQKHLLKVQEGFQKFNEFIFQEVDLKNAKFNIHANYKTPFKKSQEFLIDMKEGIKKPFDVEKVTSLKVIKIERE